MSEFFVEPVAAGHPVLAPPPGLEAFVPDGSLGRQAREYLRRVRAVLYERHRAGASGEEVVRAYTGAVDHLITSLYALAVADYAARYVRLDQRVAVIAQGGYGRGELSPCSDIDLLFLYPRRLEPFAETVAEKILHALFDTGIEVGNALRNLRQCVRLAAADLTVKTALLDARFLCGDVELYREFLALMDANVVRRSPGRFFREKIAEYDKRHHLYGDSVYILEPQLKEGKGGLRDLHTALWLARVRFKTNNLEELVRKGVLTEAELREIKTARDFLWRVRNWLHFLSGRHLDQLTFEYQEKIAAALGYVDGKDLRAVERFMRAYYMHASTIERFATEMIERCLEQPRPYRALYRLVGRQIRPGVWIANRALSVSDPKVLAEDPVNMLAIFRDAQRHGAKLSNGTRRLLRNHLHLVDGEFRRSRAAAEVLLDILRWKSDVYETLVEMHKLGVFDAYVPEFGHLLCMVQHDLYHIYTVDEHSLIGVRELERLREGAYKEEAPLLTQVVREIDKVEVLLLAVLFHDIGKGQGGRHSERGAAIARRIARRLHMNADDVHQLGFLVENHLLMSHLAQRRDIHDPRLVIEFAKRVENLDTLKKLYLMTFADMKAVGPKVWNNWKGTLLADLYLAAVEVFEKGTFVEEARETRLERIKRRVARVLEAQGVSREHIAHFMRAMPARYFLSTPEDAMPQHCAMLARLDGRRLVAAVRHFPERECTEFTVATYDRPGLFATITGVLAAAGMNVVRASITTSNDGRALDVFCISHGERADVTQDTDRWERVVNTVERALRGEVEVDQLIASAQPPAFMTKKFVPRVETAVEVDNGVSEEFTVLDVYTQDRLGVLYTITDLLYHLGLSIHLAKITTNVDQVLDVFYVTDTRGRKILEPERLEEIRAVLERRLRELQAS